MTKRFSTSVATLATVAVLTLAGCSAGSLTGPDAEQEMIRGPESRAIVNVDRGPIQRNAPHNDDIVKQEGSTNTQAPIEHNELPDDYE